MCVCVNIQALKITLVDSFLSLNQMQSKLNVYRTPSGTITPQKSTVILQSVLAQSEISGSEKSDALIKKGII